MPPFITILLLYGLGLFLLNRIIRTKTVPMSTAELAFAFGMKVMVGCAYGYVFFHYYGGDDTWMLNQGALTEWEHLIHDPGLFWYDLNPALPFQRNETFGAGFLNLLSDWEYMLITKPLAFFHVISGGNYYINVVFFNFVTFWGHYWLFSLLVRLYPQQRRWLLLLIFFFPPVVFWLSGIRADGLLLLFMALLLKQGFRWIHEKRRGALAGVLVSMLGVLIFRNALVLLIIPALASWYITVRFNRKPLTTYLLVYGCCVVLFFASSWISPHQNLPKVVTGRQHAYQALHGNTRFQLDTLQPTLMSFVAVFPQAWLNSFVRPFFWEAKGPLQAVAALDLVIFWTLVAFYLFRKNPFRKQRLRDPVLLFMLFFGVTLYLFVGYTVPFPGAIVRYKIIGELFLLAWLTLNTSWPDFQLSPSRYIIKNNISNFVPISRSFFKQNARKRQLFSHFHQKN